MTDYAHLADLCTIEITRLQKLRASYRRAEREQARQRSLNMQQMDLPTSGAPGFGITPTGPLARIEAHAQAHDPRPA